MTGLLAFGVIFVGLALFDYTILRLVVFIFLASFCLSAFIVSHRKTMLLACLGSFFYFLDAALTVHDDFAYVSNTVPYAGVGTLFLAEIPNLFAGAGCLMCFWLLACCVLDIENRPYRLFPLVFYLAISVSIFFSVSSDPMRSFFYYSMRMVFVWWILGNIGIRYIEEPSLQVRLGSPSKRVIYLVFWLLSFAVVVEDLFGFFLIDKRHAALLASWGIPGRNYTENIFVLFAMILAVRDALKTLAIRFNAPPVGEAANSDLAVLTKERILMFSGAYGLTPREREILTHLMNGEGYQQIASSLTLSLSTVKVHGHNILQKAGVHSRRELTKLFWKID